MERSEQQAECCCRLLQSFHFACCCWKLEVLEVVQRRGVLGSRRDGRLLRDVPVTQRNIECSWNMQFTFGPTHSASAVHWAQQYDKGACFGFFSNCCCFYVMVLGMTRGACAGNFQHSLHCPPHSGVGGCVLKEQDVLCALELELEWGECGRGAAGGCGPHVSPHPSSQDWEWRSFAPLWMMIFSWSVR